MRHQDNQPKIKIAKMLRTAGYKIVWRSSPSAVRQDAVAAGIDIELRTFLNDCTVSRLGSGRLQPQVVRLIVDADIFDVYDLSKSKNGESLTCWPRGEGPEARAHERITRENVDAVISAIILANHRQMHLRAMFDARKNKRAYSQITI